MDQVFADEDALGEILWGLADHQGTIRDIADYDAGLDTTNVVNHVTYDAFGGIESQSAPAVGVFHSYTGQIWDADVEAFDYDARWYDPVAQRFLSEDPSGFGGGDANLYRYVQNSPANFTDPTGLTPVTPRSTLAAGIQDFAAAGIRAAGALGIVPFSGAISTGVRLGGNDLVSGAFGSVQNFVTSVFTSHVQTMNGMLAQAGDLAIPVRPQPALTPSIPISGEGASAVAGTAARAASASAAKGAQFRAMGAFRLDARNRQIVQAVNEAIEDGLISSADGQALADRLQGLPGVPQMVTLNPLRADFWDPPEHDLIPLGGNAARQRVDAEIQLLTASRTKGIAGTAAAVAGAKAAANAPESAAAAELKPYGGPGGGHHIPAKSAFEGARGYDPNKALAVPNAELKRLGVRHGLVTGEQSKGYRAFAQTGKTLTWEAAAEIETQALIRGGMEAQMARGAEGHSSTEGCGRIRTNSNSVGWTIGGML